MEIYEKNLDALKNRHKNIYGYLEECKPDTGFFRIEFAKNGEPVLVYEEGDVKIYFNSSYNPSAEAERYMKDIVDMPDKSILVMFGLSNGSFAKEFHNKNNRDNHYIVYEPSAEIFQTVIHNVDLSDILNDDRFILVVNGINNDDLVIAVSKYLASYNVKTNKHIAVLKYADCFGEEASQMVKQLNELYDRKKIESNTILQVGAISCKNAFYNLRFFEGCRSSDDLMDVFPKDLPGIVVAAGPSLKKNVHLLREAKGKAFILCTDSAINTVLSTGVEPDMVVAVDFAKPVKLFEASQLKNIPFLADMELNTKVLEKVNPKNLFFTSSDSTWSHVFESAGSNLTPIDTGGSVATAAIASLVKWGFKRIILIGQDLAFTGNKIHADAQEEDIIDINETDYEFVEGIDGDRIPVRKDYFQYLRWIEELGGTNKDIEIIDATEGGSRKKNTTIMKFQEAIDKYCLRECNIYDILDGIPRLFTDENKKTIEEELNRLKVKISNFREKFEMTAQLCGIGEELMTCGRFEVDKLKIINSYMSCLDDEYVNSDIVLFVNKFIAQAEENLAEDMYIEEENEISEAIRMYRKSKEYYSLIANTLPNMIEIIEDCLKDMQEV